MPCVQRGTKSLTFVATAQLLPLLLLLLLLLCVSGEGDAADGNRDGTDGAFLQLAAEAGEDPSLLTPRQPCRDERGQAGILVARAANDQEGPSRQGQRRSQPLQSPSGIQSTSSSGCVTT